MTPKEKLRWFWATGILPGSVFGELNDQKVKRPEWSHHRINWLRLGDLIRQGKQQHPTGKLSSAEKVD